MWKRVIEARWGRFEEGMAGKHGTRSHGLRVWRRILMDRHKMQKCIRWRLGRGNKIHFWLNEWVVGGTLKRQFPRIYAIAQSKNMFIEDAYRDNNGSREWIVNMTRNLNDWEIKEYKVLLWLLSTVQVNENRNQLEWKLKQNGEFMVESYYKYLMGRELAGIPNFQAHQIWKVKTHPRVAFFCFGGKLRVHFDN